MSKEDKTLGRRPWLVVWAAKGLLIAVVILGLYFAYFGWWGGAPVYPPPVMP